MRLLRFETDNRWQYQFFHYHIQDSPEKAQKLAGLIVLCCYARYLDDVPNVLRLWKFDVIDEDIYSAVDIFSKGLSAEEKEALESVLLKLASRGKRITLAIWVWSVGIDLARTLQPVKDEPSKASDLDALFETERQESV